MTALIVNQTLSNGIPKNFRTCADPLETSTGYPSLIGLRNLRISGSGQFGRKGLQYILKRIYQVAGNMPVVICDLRSEPHALLTGQMQPCYRSCYTQICGEQICTTEVKRDYRTVKQVEIIDTEIPVSWFVSGNRLGENLSDIKTDELNREYIDSLYLSKDKLVPIYLVKKKNKEIIKSSELSVKVRSVISEDQLVREEFQLGYRRIPITDHEKPEIRDVDDLISLYKSKAPGVWLHFHCAAGRGRTTTAMVIIDMITNRDNNVTFSDILRRQKMLGGVDFTVLPTDTWKYQMAQDRYKFLLDFWKFIRNLDLHKDGIMYYSTYLKITGQL